MAGNPLLQREEKQAAQASGSGALYNEGTAAYAQAGAASVAGANAANYAPPGGRGTTTGRVMTMDDVIVKTGITFAILVVSAVVGWNTLGTGWLFIVPAIIATVLAFVIIFKKSSSPLLVILYSVFEGLTLGAISNWYQAYGEANGNGNLVFQAVSATIIVFAVMLIVYKTKLIRVTSKTRKVFTIMIFSYLGIALLSLVAALFGVGGGWGFYGVSGIGLLVSVFAVGLAAFSLVIDFDGIVRTTAYGVEEKESWRMAFGLMVSLVWLYLEILRLLAIVNRS